MWFTVSQTRIPQAGQGRIRPVEVHDAVTNICNPRQESKRPLVSSQTKSETKKGHTREQSNSKQSIPGRYTCRYSWSCFVAIHGWPGTRSVRLSPLADTVLVIDHARTGLNYSDFSVVTAKGSFGTTRQVAAIVQDLSYR